MDENAETKEPIPQKGDPPENQQQEHRPNYFDRIRAGLIGQRRSRRTLAKPR